MPVKLVIRLLGVARNRANGFPARLLGHDVSDSVLYHDVMTNHFAQSLETTTTGQAYPAVRPSDVADFRLQLPPLPKQAAIARLLDRVDWR